MYGDTISFYYAVADFWVRTAIKLLFFQQDVYGVSGQCLRQQFLVPPSRCSNQLLRWHFRQAVLANMRGTGDIILEHDFLPGSDMIGQILGQPKAVWSLNCFVDYQHKHEIMVSGAGPHLTLRSVVRPVSAMWSFCI